ncbi:MULTISPECIES: SDR family NAD(P)-dependent oxidoreductase [Cupriavidus]|uniref:NAD(P)-dependent dehydrogenase (Short-subunit alcohol dehydrogenase family) n=2 Tax=Cupriavidus TaxID=106589 RepID=A0A7W4YV67_9BURK|nr:MULTISPECIES: SDR family NAD(P)-dependent oxidoreductase [Cupriavidus]MBB3011292.1 NAD(P)-dependent dehydrogenase (short-subunit alcohol dehydrogenase family) [Cupriavidus alkaliphilus]QBY56299.1 SDR family NAD(P)-dependent oxidoreductase [Cupriavidus oxalaticus]
MLGLPQLLPTATLGSVLVSGVGASNGLGAAIARRFAAGGYPVVIAGRNEQKLNATASELAAAGAMVKQIVGDASISTDAARFVQAAESLAPLAVAVHNAGSNRPTPFLELSQTEFETHWREHVLGGFQLGQAALPTLLKRCSGTVIFTGASGSLRGKARYAPFAVAKAGLRALAQSLAREFGPQGIHIGHVIVDGGIDGERLLALRPELKMSRGEDGLLNIAAIADAYWMLHHQHRSAWTLELDLRPWMEPF